MHREEASQTKGRPQMAVMTELHPIRELASRTSYGIEVTLLWNRRSDELTVCVTHSDTGVHFEIEAERVNALDIFYHPFAYAAARAADPGRAAATGREQPFQRAA
jgi:hypothetical protein